MHRHIEARAGRQAVTGRHVHERAGATEMPGGIVSDLARLAARREDALQRQRTETRPVLHVLEQQDARSEQPGAGLEAQGRILEGLLDQRRGQGGDGGSAG